MARLPYADENSAETSALATRISSERDGVLPNLYRMLLNSPPVAEGWLALLTAVRQKCLIPGRVRELTILRVALLNRAEYEYEGHIPYALKSGVTQQQVDDLADWENSDAYEPDQRVALLLTDVMTESVQVPDEVFETVREAFDTRQVTELVTTIAAYNMVSRVLEAIQVDSDSH